MAATGLFHSGQPLHLALLSHDHEGWECLARRIFPAVQVLSGLGMILVVNHYIACFLYGRTLRSLSTFRARLEMYWIQGLGLFLENSWLLQANIDQARPKEALLTPWRTQHQPGKKLVLLLRHS